MLLGYFTEEAMKNSFTRSRKMLTITLPTKTGCLLISVVPMDISKHHL